MWQEAPVCYSLSDLIHSLRVLNTYICPLHLVLFRRRHGVPSEKRRLRKIIKSASFRSGPRSVDPASGLGPLSLPAATSTVLAPRGLNVSLDLALSSNPPISSSHENQKDPEYISYVLDTMIYKPGSERGFIIFHRIDSRWSLSRYKKAWINWINSSLAPALFF